MGDYDFELATGRVKVDLEEDGATVWFCPGGESIRLTKSECAELAFILAQCSEAQ